MDWFKLCLILISFNINLISSKDCVRDKTSSDSIWEARLRRELTKCTRYVNLPPKNDTEVHLSLQLRTFSYDSIEETFSIYSWVNLRWKDERIQWRPEEYHGIDNTHFANSKLWYPALYLVNSADGENIYFPLSMCRVDYSGEIHCRIPNLHTVNCLSNLREWPFDSQNCTLRYASKAIGAKFVSAGRILRMLGADYGKGWIISDYHEENDGKRPNITLTLERDFVSVSAFIVVPVMATFLLVILSLLLDVKNENRLAVLVFSILLQLLNLTQINEFIPHYSNDTPKILVLAKISLIITVLLLLLSFVFVKLRSKLTPIPARISVVNDFIRKGRLKYFIWPRWEPEFLNLTIAEDLLEKSKNLEEWTDLANILNSVCLLIVFVTYLLLYFALMPQPTAAFV